MFTLLLANSRKTQFLPITIISHPEYLQKCLQSGLLALMRLGQGETSQEAQQRVCGHPGAIAWAF